MQSLISEIKKLIRKNYLLTRLLFEYKFYKNNIGAQPILIYQMGKVGSTSILHSLQADGSFPNVFQVHVLSKQGIQAMEKRYWGNTPLLFRKSLLPETTHVFISHSLRTRLHKNKNAQWKIITLVRDPIARNVSEFFYSVDTTKDDPHLPNFYNRYQSGDVKTSELLDRFLERFSDTTEEYAVPLIWFDDEFSTTLGVDVYANEFPKSEGFQIIHAEGCDVLILKLEKLKNCYRSAFREFLGLENFEIVTANTASEKKYYTAYNDFIQEASLPSQYISRIYESKFVRHFYDEQEIEQFTRKWRKV